MWIDRVVSGTLVKTLVIEIMYPIEIFDRDTCLMSMKQPMKWTVGTNVSSMMVADGLAMV